MSDTLILPVDHQFRNGQPHGGVLFEVDDHVHVVLDVHLGDEAGSLHVGQLVRTHFVVAQLVDLVALEDIAAGSTVEEIVLGIVLWNAGIELGVLLLVVVGDWVVIGQVQDELLVEFLNGHIRGVGTGNDLEAVVEERLGLVVGDAHQFHGGERIAGRGPCPHHSHGDVVVVARLQGERSCGLDEAAVC